MGPMPIFYRSVNSYSPYFSNNYSVLDDKQQSVIGIDCVINQEYSVSCVQKGDEVYVPFSFLRDYFEIFGSLSSMDNGPAHFEWSHSNAKINYPKGSYDPRGIFMYFENYNVEVRDRVKCVSASDGVPISTQWEVLGYPYPTQIAQFGLSHYSKNLTDPEPRKKVSEAIPAVYYLDTYYYLICTIYRIFAIQTNTDYRGWG